jgi:hypothetical protein
VSQTNQAMQINRWHGIAMIWLCNKVQRTISSDREEIKKWISPISITLLFRPAWQKKPSIDPYSNLFRMRLQPSEIYQLQQSRAH